MAGVIDLRTGQSQRSRQNVNNMIQQLIQQKIADSNYRRGIEREDMKIELGKKQQDRKLQNDLMTKGWVEAPEGEEGATPFQFTDGVKYYKQKEQPERPFEVNTYNTPYGVFYKAGDKVGVMKRGETDPYSGLEIGYTTFLKGNELTPSKENYQKYIDHKISLQEQMRKQPEAMPYITKLMAAGWVPSQRITQPMLDAYENMAKEAAQSGKALTPQDLYDFEFNAQKNRRLGQTSGSRLVVQRKQNIEAARGLLADMKVTAEKLDYPDVKFGGVLEKWKNKQLNDPIFTEYMTQRADALFVLGNALKQNGLTDKSIEVEEEAANPTMSPKAFNAWYNVQVRALNRAAEEIEKDYRFPMVTSPSVEAGKGGAGEAKPWERQTEQRNETSNRWDDLFNQLEEEYMGGR